MISLILATRGRKIEVQRCIASVLSQVDIEFELLIIDQNPSGFLSEIIDSFVSSRIRYYNVNFSGLSRSRNYALALARFDIIGLIDDDSILYDYQHLLKVAKILLHKDCDFVSGICLNEDLSDANYFFPKMDCLIDSTNIFKSVMSPCLFFRKKHQMQFDELLGVGSIFGSSEESDFIIDYLRHGSTGLFTRQLSVIHPEGESKLSMPARRYNYGKGLGALLFKKFTFFGLAFIVKKLLGPLVRSFLLFVQQDYEMSKLYLIDFWGRLLGFVLYPIVRLRLSSK